MVGSRIGASYPCRVKLRGLERMVSMADGASMKIVHSMLVTGDVDTLAKYLPEALTRTFNIHPRMRALQVKDDVFVAEIQAPITIDTVESRDLLRLQLITDCDSSEDSFENWQRYAEQECNVGRYPYPKEFSLAEDGELKVKSLHVYNSIPHLGPSACFFLTSVESFSYAMANKCQDDAAEKLFTAWTGLTESIGNVGSEDTLADVLSQLGL